MNSAGFICQNGEFIRKGSPVIYADNRAFRYGDALYETMRAYATEPLFLHHHLERLVYWMKILSMDVPPGFTVDNFRALTSKLLNKNHHFGSAGLRLSVFRNPGINSLPDTPSVSYLLESEKLQHNYYELNTRGLAVDLYTETTKQVNKYSGLKTANAMLYVLAGIHIRNNALEEAVIINQNGKLVESMNSNIFLVKNKTIYTPGIHQGCMPGIMRTIIIEIARDQNFIVNDQCQLSPAAIEDADEFFLTDVLSGIRWVGAFRNKRFYKKTAQLLLQKLNEKIFGVRNNNTC